MKNQNNFDGGTIARGLKKNWSEEEFSIYFEIPENEFLSRVKSSFSESAYKRILKQLKRNRKLVERGRVK